MLKERTSSPRLTPEQLQATVEKMGEGTIPVLLSIPHDGVETSINGVTLPYSENIDGKKRDIAVSVIGKRALQRLKETYQETPLLLSQRVHRLHRTQEVESYFGERALASVAQFKNGNPLLLDLHGFSRPFPLGDYDLVLGTSHRKSLRGTTLDQSFASFMRDMGYSVYVPQEHVVKGERYEAEEPQTLMQKLLRSPHVTHVIGMQVEISIAFRRVEDDGIAKGNALADNLASFIASTYLPKKQADIAVFPHFLDVASD